MARTNIPSQEPLGPFPTLPVTADGLDIAFTDGNASEGNEFTATGSDLLIAKNIGSGARTITLLSVVDQFNRTGDITTYSLGAGEVASFFFGTNGWLQSNGKININVSHAEVKLAILALANKFAHR